MSDQLRSALDDLAGDTPPPAPVPDLWRRGKRRQRRRQVLAAAAAVAVLAGAGTAFAAGLPGQEAQPARQDGTVGLPDRLYGVSPDLPGTDELGPPGRIAAVFANVTVREDAPGSVVAVSAQDGSYRFLDLPQLVGSDGFLLSPDGRHLAMVDYLDLASAADDVGDGVADTRITGIAVYDAETGEVRSLDLGLAEGSTFFTAEEDLGWTPDSGHLVLDVCPVTYYSEADGNQSINCQGQRTLAIDVEGLTPTDLDLRSRESWAVGPGGVLVGRGQDWEVVDVATGARRTYVSLPRAGTPHPGPEQRYVVLHDATPAVGGDPGDRRLLTGRVAADGTGDLGPTGVENVYRVVGWVDGDTVAVTRSGGEAAIETVDLDSGEARPLIERVDTNPPQLATDLLTGPTVAGVRPPDPAEPVRFWGGALVAGLGAAGLLLLGRRTR